MTTEPHLPPTVAAAFATVAQSHSTLARLYQYLGDHRRSTSEAKQARVVLDMIAPTVTAWQENLEVQRMTLAAEALEERVHQAPLTLGDLPAAQGLDEPEPTYAKGRPVPDHLTLPEVLEHLVADVDDQMPNVRLSSPALALLRERLLDLETSANPARADTTAGAELVRAERVRQIEEEGYVPEEDLAYLPSTLAQAAGSYLLAATADHPEDLPVPGSWPWAAETWRPSADQVRNLVKAAALIVAEVDARLLTQERAQEEERPLLSLVGLGEQTEGQTLSSFLAEQGIPAVVDEGLDVFPGLDQAPTVEDLLARSAPTAAGAFACPFASIEAGPDRCGQFTADRPCAGGVCALTSQEGPTQ